MSQCFAVITEVIPARLREASARNGTRRSPGFKREKGCQKSPEE